ncbi:MAG: asparagine synthase (glutamine-hydrolyzing) [Phycisphaerales bacterium]|nr:asparagine synthase (glutamine-hydrolyzing) [Phycisphaerales bacterium]
MCGICGILVGGRITPRDRLLLRHLNGSMAHRGPDGEGYYEADQVAIGMRRLSIIDLQGGWQPLWNEDHSVALVANGEIYNFVELRRDLEARGHRFRTKSDCETIVHLYEEHGSDCVKHLRGMFAFCLVDITRRRVLLARDRIGEKPLYLVQKGERITFASELRALVGSGVVPFEIDPGAVNLYLHYGFVPEFTTAIRGVRKLQAGHLMEIDLTPFRVKERRWWRMDQALPIDAEPGAAIRDSLNELSSLVVRSDVPVGVALSGGIDSSLIAALAHHELGDRLTAISVGYEGGAWQDETGLAKEFADTIGIKIHIRRMRIEEVVDRFAEVCFKRDDPTADLSGSSYFAIMEAARDAGVHVMLMGHGGDELFWGYKWMRDAALRMELKAKMLRGEAGLLNYLRPKMPTLSWTSAMNWIEHGFGLRRGYQDWVEDRTGPRDQLPPWDPTYTWRSVDDIASVVLACWEEARKTDPTALFRGQEYQERPDISIPMIVSESYMAVNGIAQGDRLSMAASVECRLPLVDYRFIETAVGLRKAHSDLHLPPKTWLKAAARDTVPAFVFARRKRGFSPPWKRWYEAIFNRHMVDLRNGALVRAGIVRRGAYDEVRRTTHWSGRPYPLLMPMLILEGWAQGMASASANAPRLD